MKEFFRGMFVLVAAAALAVSCSKDKDHARISFDQTSVYFGWDDTKTVSFSSSNVKSYSVSTKPTGWVDPVIDADAKTMKITSPVEGDEDAVQSGTLTIAGISYDGKVVTASIFVSISETVDLSAEPANSYIVNRKQTNYLFDAMHKGDGKSSLETASVKVIWQTRSSLIQYLSLSDGKASFYVGANDDDELVEGNALIGAYDAAGNLLWSWHVWATDYDPESADGAVSFNGYTMMNRNLGALDNSNESAAEILASYGLYYQWGRKDPFVGPSTYQASNGTSATMYNGSNGRVELKSVTTTAQTGTEEYAREHPVSFLVGVSESKYDWMWDGSDGRWNGTKTVNDPCPYGWKVAPAAAFAELRIKEPLEGIEYGAYADKYGWTLTDGTSESLFMGGGRRIYTHINDDKTDGGKFQNIYVNPDDERLVRNEAMYDQPWVGFYWTADVSAAQSSAFYFFFNKRYVERSRVEGAVPHYRANGMMVRCVADK